MTNGLTAMRKALDPSWAGPPNPSQDILATSAAYGVYMSVSSNLRYQVVAGARVWRVKALDLGLWIWV